MRIALVINSSWNIYNFRMGLIRELKANGHDVYAIAPEDEFSDDLKKIVDFYPTNIAARGTNPIHDIALVARLVKTYKTIKPDVILHYTIKPNIYGSFAAAIAGIPCISTVSGLGTVFLHNTFSSKIAIALYRQAFKTPFKVIFQNNDDRQLLVKKGIVAESKTYLVAGSGVDLDKFSFQPLPPSKPFRFLMISRILKDKGVYELAQAAEIVKNVYPDTEILIAGSLDNTELGIPSNIIDKWQKSGLINHLGFTKNIHQLIASVQCVVLPSYREGTPKSLLEAAATGRPLIATRVPGCVEVVKENENGFLCEAKNSQDLAEKMIEMLNQSQEQLDIMGRNSRSLVESKFSEKKVANQYLSIINSIK